MHERLPFHINCPSDVSVVVFFACMFTRKMILLGSILFIVTDYFSSIFRSILVLTVVFVRCVCASKAYEHYIVARYMLLLLLLYARAMCAFRFVFFRSLVGSALEIGMVIFSCSVVLSFSIFAVWFFMVSRSLSHISSFIFLYIYLSLFIFSALALY